MTIPPPRESDNYLCWAAWLRLQSTGIGTGQHEPVSELHVPHIDITTDNGYVVRARVCKLCGCLYSLR